jgi:calreticulin
MNKLLLSVVISCLVLIASAKVHFKEEFDAGWRDRWVQSDWKESEGTRGEFGWTAGKYFHDAEADKGLQTSQDARFYATSAKIPEAFSNEGKDLVVQYQVKHEQNIDCGGGYIKLLPSSLNQKTFNGDAEYNIMFGPDICGASTKKVHLIFTYKGKNHLIKKNVPAESDTFTHLYTMILHPDNTYEIQVDQKELAKGSLKEDWDILPAKQIKDPQAKKPSDWVDDKEIADPEDVKPEGWDDIPAQIADNDASKPEDWDDKLDGEWEAPQIPNPEYKGEWKAKQIPNPLYKGEWIHPLIDNPEYTDDDNLYLFKDNAYVGFELWQVKAGTIFDNIIVTDSIEEANDFAAATYTHTVKGEKAAKEADEKKQEEERKKAEDEAAANAEKEEEEESKEEEEKGKDEL